MKTCNCTLHITNPEACSACTSNDYSDNYWTIPIIEPSPYKSKTIKRITRTIEKFGPDGEYLGKEIITEDVEDFEIPDYSYNFYDYNDLWCDSDTVSTDVSSDMNHLSSYTTNLN